MATRKSEKDKRIEELEEVNRTLRRRNAWALWLENLPKGKKILFVLLFVSILYLLIGLFAFQAIQAAKPVSLSSRGYELLLSEVDGRKWKVAKGSYEALGIQVHGSPSGYAYTRRSGENILLVLYGEMENIYQFSYHEGKVIGIVSSYPSFLNYSESTLKSGRALTLEVGKVKLVFYEEK